MKITFIGAGNLATHLADRFYQTGNHIAQVYSRSIESAKTLADRVGAKYTASLSDITDASDLYIFSVKDSVLLSLIENIPHIKGVWVHTAGSISADVFKGRSKNYGVLYPLQTFSKNRNVNWENIPIFIESNNSTNLQTIEGTAKQLSEHVYELQSDKRIYIHAAAVFACNFVNHMYEQAKMLSDKVDVPFSILYPLIEETCKKLQEMTPHEAQTGPAIRFDTNVMEKHLDLLDSEGSKTIYKLISDSIHNSFKNS